MPVPRNVFPGLTRDSLLDEGNSTQPCQSSQLNLDKSDRMSKEKQKFFRLSAFNCDRSQGPNPLSPRSAGEVTKKSKQDGNSMLRPCVKVSKLSDTSDDDDDNHHFGASSASASAAVAGRSSDRVAGSTAKESKRNGDANERLSDSSSSSCSSSNDSSSSSDSCSDDDSSDDSDDDSSSLSTSSLSSSYEPDPDAKPPGGGASGKSGDKFSSKKGSLPFDSGLSLSKKSGHAGGSGSGSQTRGSFSFKDFSEKHESDGVWGFAAEAKKGAEIFSTPPANSKKDAVFGSFAGDKDSAASGSRTPASSRGRKPLQREVMKETRNTFNRDFVASAADTPSTAKRRASKVQSDSNNNTNAASSKKVAATSETKRKGSEALATPRAALAESAANDNFVSPSGSASRATTTSSPPYSIYGQSSIGKDAIPFLRTGINHSPLTKFPEQEATNRLTTLAMSFLKCFVAGEGI